MWLEAGLFRLAEEFWEGVPLPCRALPRDLAAVVSLALPVTVREVRDLTTRDVERRLHTYEVPYVPDSPCRRLRGCLIAYGGYGVILVDGADPGDQRRFTAAHEVAHFLVDYMEPRRRAIEALGRGIMPVLDGARPPTSTERLNAILGAVSLGLHLDIMERTGRGGYTSRSTLASEERADRLALDLLAPAADAWSAIIALPEAQTGTYAALQAASARMLHERYGLPIVEAERYAQWLLEKGGRKPGLCDWLGG